MRDARAQKEEEEGAMFGNDDQSKKHFQEAFAKALQVFNNDVDSALSWINEPSKMLNEEIPIHLLESNGGYGRVMEELDRIKSISEAVT